MAPLNDSDDPLKSRRAQAHASEKTDVTFTSKVLSEERLQALRDFLKHAKSDEILAIRRLYGDNPEVLRSIGMEVD